MNANIQKWMHGRAQRFFFQDAFFARHVYEMDAGVHFYEIHNISTYLQS